MDNKNNNNKQSLPSEELSMYLKAMTLDYKKISELLEESSKINIPTLKDQFNEYKETSSLIFKNRINRIKSNFDDKFNKLKQKMSSKVVQLKEEIKSSENHIEMIGYELPTSNFTYEEIKNTFKKLHIKKTKGPSLLNNDKKDTNNSNNDNISNILSLNGRSLNLVCIEEVENIISLIKKFSDNEKLNNAYKTMQNIVYWKFLNEKKEIFLTTITEKQDIITKTIKDNICDLKSNFIQQKELGSYTLNDNVYFDSNPNNLKKTAFLVSKQCQKGYTIDSVFCAFNTYDQNPFIAWTTSENTVEILNVNNNKIEIKKAHNQHVYIVRHFFDKRVNIDYLLSTSYDKKAVVYDYVSSDQTFKVLITINTAHSGLYLYSGVIVFDFTSEKPIQDSTLIVTSVPHEQLKVFNLKGTLIRHLGNKSDYTYYINTYYDSKKNSFFIINANSQDIKIIDFKDGSTVKTFKEQSESHTWHMSAFIAEMNSIYYLFETDGNGNIRIWNYELSQVHIKMNAPGCSLRGLILWNEKYLISASSDKSYKIFNIEDKILENTVPCHDNVVCSVQKILHPKLGESLLTCSIDGNLKLFGQ